MNKQQFLNSGLLEQFVLGLTSPEEDKIVQQYLHKFPELNNELNALHQAMDQYALQHAIPPPKSQYPAEAYDANAYVSDSHYRFNWSLLTTIVLAFLSFYLFRNNQHQQKDILQIEAEHAALKTYCQTSQDKVQAQLLMLDKIQHPHTQSIVLAGTEIAPAHFAVAHWNPTLKEGWLDPTKLPILPKGKQYQVWADINGEMISIALIPPNSRELISIAYMDNAESINITEEALGGADHPNVDLLMANATL
ncbi:anti-sigma factor [Lewinella sp. LCG006]|uniref:anti-sigma factor domain-containing protein n=1 Tax=Lewinella sp. LCG006 TaxID=3231911 RepID=UPI00345F91B6